jgi:hypothetical protein
MATLIKIDGGRAIVSGITKFTSQPSLSGSGSEEQNILQFILQFNGLDLQFNDQPLTFSTSSNN